MRLLEPYYDSGKEEGANALMRLNSCLGISYFYENFHPSISVSFPTEKDCNRHVHL